MHFKKYTGELLEELLFGLRHDGCYMDEIEEALEDGGIYYDSEESYPYIGIYNKNGDELNTHWPTD